mgnify:FL=1
MMSKDRAELLGVQALGWMAGRDDTLEAFLGAAGCAPDDLRTRAKEPEFLGFVLDFLLGDDAVLMAFCEDGRIREEDPRQARAVLPGGDAWRWT